MMSVFLMEARVRIELTHKGFADLSLTTWVPRLNLSSITNLGNLCNRRSFPPFAQSAPPG